MEVHKQGHQSESVVKKITHYPLRNKTYRQVSNIWRTKSQTLKRFSYCHVSVFAESLEARCQAENEDVVVVIDTFIAC